MTFKNLIDWLNKNGVLFNFIIKPFILLLISVSVGYYTYWQKANFVTRAEYKQDLDKYWISTSAKLDEILLNQRVDSEKIRGLISEQDKLDLKLVRIDDRIIYLERAVK